MAARPRIRPSGPRIGGLPAYTREQFKQVRPNGRYDNYLAYIRRARGITGKPGAGNPPYPGRAGPGLPTYMSMLRGMQFETPAQLEARARRMAGNDYKFAQQAAAQAYKQAQDDAMRRMLAFQSAGRAAAGMNASLIGQVGGMYTQGADQLSQLAAAGAASMAGATDAAVASANQATSNVGMPGVTVGGPVGQPGIAGATQAGVESYRGGTLPAQALTNAGGFASAEMSSLIGSQNLRATQEAQAAYMSAIQEANAARAQAQATALAGRKSGIGDYLLKLQDAQRQQYALAMSLIEGRRNALQTGFAQGGEKIKRKQDAETHAAQMRAAKQALAAARQQAKLQGREIDMTRSAALKHYVDNMGRPILYTSGPKKGQMIPVPPTVTAAAGGKTTTTPLPQQMANAADQWLYRHRDRRGNITGTVDQLTNYLMAVYPSANRKTARAIAQGLLGPTGKVNTGKVTTAIK